MKKIILMAASLFFVGQVSAKVIFHKSNGGLFGYKYVTETTWENSTTVVACCDPGLTRCKAMSTALVTPSGPEISPETLELIDNAVTSNITPTNLNGQMLFANTFFVTYTYNPETDSLDFIVYSISEATALGLI